MNILSAGPGLVAVPEGDGVGGSDVGSGLGAVVGDVLGVPEGLGAPDALGVALADPVGWAVPPPAPGALTGVCHAERATAGVAQPARASARPARAIRAVRGRAIGFSRGWGCGSGVFLASP